MNHPVKYFRNGSEHYKVNTELRRITKIDNNDVSYPSYDENIETVSSYKKIKMNDWKHIENSFFISRHFEWEYDGSRYTTTDDKIEFVLDKYSYVAMVFHNGFIWKAYNSGNYYPRMFIERINKRTNQKTHKWTDIKYLRAFKKI